MLTYVPRQYQLDGVNDIAKAWAAGYKRVIYALLPGAGKSTAFCLVTERALKNGATMLVMAHRRQLIKQLAERLMLFKIPYRIEMSNLPDEPWVRQDDNPKVYVASKDTLISRCKGGNWDNVPQSNMLCIDECVTGDTLVMTDKGPVRIDSVVDRGCRLVLSQGPSGPRFSRIVCFMKQGVKSCFLIRLKNGRSISCTGNHPVMTQRGWVRAEMLSTTDLVKGTDHADSPEVMGTTASEFTPRLEETCSEKHGISCRSVCDTSWSQVVEVTLMAGRHATYDLEVETDHNFYANGILVHNCHHVEQEEYATLAARCPAKWWLGLTGTPMRPDGSGLGKNNWDYIVTGPSFRQLQDMGFLVPLRVFADKALGQRRKSGEKTGVIGDPVGHWRRNAEGRPTLGFTRSVSEARFLADQFDKDGIPSAVLNAESSFEERTEVLGKLADGKLLWVGNAFLLGEGVDIPQLGCIQLLRKCGGLRDYIQLVSRVVRSCPAIGKTDGILLDHSGAALDHRYPEIELEWHLDESAEAFRKRIKEQKEKELAPAVTCNSCGCVFAGRPTCPHCGTPLPPSRKRSKPIIERGLLTEIGCNAGAERKSQLQKTWETVLAMAKAKNWSVKKTNVIFNNYTGMYPEKANVHPLFRREDRELTVVEVLCPPTSAN